MKILHLFIGLFACSSMIVNGQSSVAKQYPIAFADTLTYCLKSPGIGAGGFDLVTYFESEKPAPGAKAFKAMHDSIFYYFLNEENKAKFLSSPNRYLPAYGGWCSMTLAMGRATTPVYENYLIIDGTLHLFERTMSVNGKLLWQQDPLVHAQRARTNYNDFVPDGIISKN